MKYAFLENFEVCNTNGENFYVDLLVLQSANADLRFIMYSPGTLDEVNDTFFDHEQEAWFEHSEPHMRSCRCCCDGPTTDPGGNCTDCGREA